MGSEELSAALHVGFLTVFQEGPGYVGGLLITNSWGRPVEFRLSTAISPNRVQQILYGGTLEEYLCGELIGRTLIEKAASSVQIVFTDNASVLAMRAKSDFPVLALLSDDVPVPVGSLTLTDGHTSRTLVYSRKYAADRDRIIELLSRIDAGFDLAEPFSRIREAMGEARRMGVTSRG